MPDERARHSMKLTDSPFHAFQAPRAPDDDLEHIDILTEHASWVHDATAPDISRACYVSDVPDEALVLLDRLVTALETTRDDMPHATLQDMELGIVSEWRIILATHARRARAERMRHAPATDI